MKKHTYESDMNQFMRDNPDYIPPESFRKRNFACVVYDLDLNSWRERLDKFHIASYISPLHDKDYNIANEPKKPHYHVMIMFDGNKSIRQVQEVFSSICGVGLEIVESLRGYARYLCHLDNPSKFRYQESQVIELNSPTPYMDLISSSADKVSATRDMLFVIRKDHIHYFSEFVDYCIEYKPEWHYLLLNGCVVFIKEYIKSFAVEERDRLAFDDSMRDWE